MRNLYPFKAVLRAIRAKGTTAEVDSDMATVYACRIIAGAQWLDAVDRSLPDEATLWWKDWSVSDLDLNNCQRCVLGTVVGDYRACVLEQEYTGTLVDRIVAEYGRDEAKKIVEHIDIGKAAAHEVSYTAAFALGFHLDEDEYAADYAALTRGWVALVEYRRTADLVPA